MVNVFASVLAFGNGSDRAGVFAGQGNFDNGVVGTNVGAAAAFDAFGLVNDSPVGNFNCLFGAVEHAGAGKTGAAVVADQISLAHAGGARRFDDGEDARGCGCPAEGFLAIAVQRDVVSVFGVGIKTHCRDGGIFNIGAVGVKASPQGLRAVGTDDFGNAVCVGKAVFQEAFGNLKQNFRTQKRGIIFRCQHLDFLSYMIKKYSKFNFMSFFNM